MLAQGDDDKGKSTEKGPRGAARVRLPSPYENITKLIVCRAGQNKGEMTILTGGRFDAER